METGIPQIVQDARQQDSTAQLVGDLVSTPDPQFWWRDADVIAFEWMRPYAGAEGPFLEELIANRKAQLEAELANSNPFSNAMLRQHVSHQMRIRPDYQREKLAVEQWIPAMKGWMVNGYFPPNTEMLEIIRQLQAGDPTKKSATEALQEAREEAAKIRARNEADGDLKVKQAVADLGSDRIRNFVEVEQALQTGENITVRGDDRRTIEKLTENTRRMAEAGDVEAQAVIDRGGVKDNALCSLPTTNPFRHRHRKELEQGGSRQP